MSEWRPWLVCGVSDPDWSSGPSPADSLSVPRGQILSLCILPFCSEQNRLSSPAGGAHKDSYLSTHKSHSPPG